MLRMRGCLRISWSWLISAVVSTIACGQEMSGHGEAARSGTPPGAMSHPMPASPMPPSMNARPAAPATRAVVPSMSMADFERIALQRNPTLRQATAQFDAAMNRSLQAGLYPNPVIGYVQDQIGSYSESQPTAHGFAVKGKPSPGDNIGPFIQWQIVTAGKLRLSRAKFAEEANAARWQAIGQELRVINNVRILFFEVLAAQRLIEIHRELFRLDEDLVRTTREMVNVGQANQPDLLEARVRERRERVALRNAENRYRGDWEELVSVVGAPELRPTVLDPRPLEAEIGPLDFDGTLADLLHRSPEIQAALSEIRRDQIMVRRERVEPIPNILVQGVTGYNYEFGVQTAGVQVGFTLPLFNRNQGTIREAMSDLTRDHAEYERIRLLLRQRLAEVFTRYQNAVQSVEDFRAESLPLARRAYEMRLTSYHQRRTEWPRVLESRRSYFDLSQDYVESLLELRKAEVEIGGMLLMDGLSSPATPTSQGHIEAVPTPR